MHISINGIPLQKLIYTILQHRSLQILIASNLFPLVGALLFGWDIREVFIAYWIETIIIHLIIALKIYYACGDIYMTPVTDFGSMDRSFRIQSIIQYLTVAAFISTVYGIMIAQVFLITPATITHGQLLTILYMTISFSLSHLYAFFKNYLGKQEYLKATEQELRGGASHRLYTMHMALWAGGMLAVLIHITALYTIFLILIKTWFDIRGYIKGEMQ